MNNFWPTWKQNPLMTAFVSVLLLLVITLVGVKAWNGLVEHGQIGRVPMSRDMITMDGEGKVTGKPTLAQVELGTYTEGSDVPTTQTQNAQKVNAILAAVKSLSVADADVQTSNYSISPKFDYKNGTQNIIGYTVSQTITVKVRNLSKVGDVLAKAGALGANQINGVTFTIDDPTSLQQEARKKALADAREKAQELADALGVNIARVVTFSEITNTPMPYMDRGMGGAMATGAIAPPNIQSGSLDVVSRVSVTFEIK